ncbi:hypothetical protein KCU65_g6608, partial [Aureobasidium melanogenum]
MVTDKGTQLQLKLEAANAKLAELEAEQINKEDQIEAIFGSMMSEISGVIDKAGISSRSRYTIEKSIVEARIATRKVLFEEDEEEEEEDVKPKGKGKGKVSTNVAVVITPKTPGSPQDSCNQDSQDDEDLQLVFPRNSTVSTQHQNPASIPSVNTQLRKPKSDITVSQRRIQGKGRSEGCQEGIGVRRSGVWS